MKVAALKLMDALISDSRNRIEKNELSLYREHLELMPLSEIKKGVEDTLKSSEEFLNMNRDSDVEEPVQDNKTVPKLPTDLRPIKDDQSFLPESPHINPEAFNPTPINQGLTASEHAFLDEEEKVMRLKERGMA